jgi:aminoglycoside phosphotransferase
VERFNLKGNEMAESKFTPGPWVAEKVIGAKWIHWSIHTEDQFVGSTGFLGISLEEQQANAELMADAPRMLEVLRTLHDFALPLRDRGLAAESEQAFADARALLEKHGG